MQTSQVSVTTTRTALSTVDRKRTVVVKHTTTGSTVYLGGPDVTASGATGGWALGADDPIEMELDESLYAITASGTVTVYVMSVG